MGRVYAATGIQFNFSGTTTPTQVTEYSGTSGTAQVYWRSFSNRFQIFTDSGSILLEADDHDIMFFTSAETIINIGSAGIIDVTIGTGGVLRALSSAGTLMELNGNTGDLRIAGTLGTGIVF